jgi:hypothetical protein
MATRSEKDELGFQMAIVLFLVLIPALFAIAVYLSPSEEVIQAAPTAAAAE